MSLSDVCALPLEYRLGLHRLLTNNLIGWHREAAHTFRLYRVLENILITVRSAAGSKAHFQSATELGLFPELELVTREKPKKRGLLARFRRDTINGD